MKIGVIQSSCPTPSEIFVYNQITELQKRGHEVRLFGHPNKQATPELRRWYAKEVKAPMFHPWPTPRNQALGRIALGLHKINEPRNARESLKKLVSMGRPAPWLDPAQLYCWGRVFLNHQDLDVFLAHFAPVAGVIAALKECGIVRCPLVAALHGADVTSDACLPHITSGLYPRLWRQAEAYTYNSSFIRERAVDLGFPRDRMTQVQMAVGELFLQNFYPQTKPPGSPFHILSVGRFVEKKGHLTGLRAFQELLKTRRNCQYTIVGDGALRSGMEAFICDAGIGGSVRLAGELTQVDVREVMLESDVFLFPSETATNGDMEGQGLVVQEAQACGLPVIVTRHNGVPDGMVDGKTGYVVEERDWKAMAKKLNLLANEPALCSTVGSAARDFVLKKFSGAVLAEQLESVLMATISQGRPFAPKLS